MEENIKVNMSIIKKKDLELIIGLTEEYLKECGKTDIKIGELFGHNLNKKEKEYESMDKGLSGLNNIFYIFFIIIFINNH